MRVLGLKIESGCSIEVVCVFWEHEARVRFSAPRLNFEPNVRETFAEILNKNLQGLEFESRIIFC